MSNSVAIESFFAGVRHPLLYTKKSPSASAMLPPPCPRGCTPDRAESTIAHAPGRVPYCFFFFEESFYEASRFYADRAAGGDRHHRRVGRAFAARRPEGARGGQPDEVPEQPQANWSGGA